MVASTTTAVAAPGTTTPPIPRDVAVFLDRNNPPKAGLFGKPKPKKPRHFRHHRECRTQKCARHADRLWAKHHRPKYAVYGNWAIPAIIVKCESGFKNDPPNSATAAGYYQITFGTWPEGGGRGSSDASQHSKAEQDRVAHKLWAGGAGIGRWHSSEPCWGGQL